MRSAPSATCSIIADERNKRNKRNNVHSLTLSLGGLCEHVDRTHHAVSSGNGQVTRFAIID
jgi:hypothetical protein